MMSFFHVGKTRGPRTEFDLIRPRVLEVRLERLQDCSTQKITHKRHFVLSSLMSSVHTLLVCCWRDGRGSNHRLQWTIALGLDALKCGTSISRETQRCPTRSKNCPNLAFLTWWCISDKDPHQTHSLNEESTFRWDENVQRGTFLTFLFFNFQFYVRGFPLKRCQSQWEERMGSRPEAQYVLVF